MTVPGFVKDMKEIRRKAREHLSSVNEAGVHQELGASEFHHRHDLAP